MKANWKIILIFVVILVTTNGFWLYQIVDNAVENSYYKGDCEKYQTDSKYLKKVLQNFKNKEDLLYFLSKHSIPAITFRKGEETIVQLQSSHLEFIFEEEIIPIWKEFLQTLSQRDTQAFKALADDKIYCLDCLSNTPQEYEKLEKIQEADSDWYDKMYSEWIYIPVKTFIKEDFDLIFTKSLVQLLQKSKTSFHYRKKDGNELYEILVNTTPPSPGHEGGQHHFQFRKIKGKWKLSYVGTIP